MSGSSTSRRAAATATLCLVVAASGSVHAQRAMSQYLRDEWTSDRGFPGGPVHAVTQTTDGYLWIGAEKGLVRFDGLTFRLFEPKGTLRTPPRRSSASSPRPMDRCGRGCAASRCFAISTSAFENILPTLGAPESVVTAMERGRDDAILAATLGRGAHDLAQRTCRRRSRTRARCPGSSFVISMAQTPNGDFWLGTRGAGVAPRPGHARDAIHGRVAGPESELPARDGRSATCGSAPTRASRDGRERRSARSGIPGVLTNLQALAMIRDRAGNVWIAAGSDGLVRVDDRGRASRWAVERARPAATCRRCSRIGTATSGSARIAASSGGGIRSFTSFSTAQGLPSAADRTRVRRRSRTHVVCADERRLVLDRRRRGRPRHRGGPRSRRRVLDRRRRRRRVGRQTARRRHASAPVGERMVGHAAHARPTGFRRTASTPSRSRATARSGRAR